jgi:hypothetical protein
VVIRKLQALHEIGRMLHAMIGKARLFCGERDPILKETESEYSSLPPYHSIT